MLRSTFLYFPLLCLSCPCVRCRKIARNASFYLFLPRIPISAREPLRNSPVRLYSPVGCSLFPLARNSQPVVCLPRVLLVAIKRLDTQRLCLDHDFNYRVCLSLHDLFPIHCHARVDLSLLCIPSSPSTTYQCGGKHSRNISLHMLISTFHHTD